MTRRPTTPFLYALVVSLMAPLGLGPESKHAREQRRQRRATPDHPTPDGGQFNVNAILTLAFIVVGAFVTVTIVADLAPNFITSVADLNNELATADLNDTTATSVIQLMPTLIGIGAAVGLTLLALAAVQLRRR